MKAYTVERKKSKARAAKNADRKAVIASLKEQLVQVTKESDPVIASLKERLDKVSKECDRARKDLQLKTTMLENMQQAAIEQVAEQQKKARETEAENKELK